MFASLSARTFVKLPAALLVLFFALNGLTVVGQTKAAKRVLVISLDGLDTRYIQDPAKYGLKIPTLRKLMADGVTASGMTSVYPSITYPNHTSLMTGGLPSAHGIFGNGVYSAPDKPSTGESHWFARDIKIDTIWDSAKRAGLKVGMVSWPVAGGVGDWNVPEIWKPRGTPADSRQAISDNARPAGLVEEITRAFPDIHKNTNADEGDDARTAFAEYIIREKRPEVMLVHLFDLDHFQHDFGPFTAESLAMLEKTDGYVARLLAAASAAGTLSETAVFITSDHGFKPVTRQLNPGVLLAKAGLVTTKSVAGANGNTVNSVEDWKASVYVTGAACAIYLRDPADGETLSKVKQIFTDLVGTKDGGIFKVVDASELKMLGSNTSAAIMLEAADGFTFGGSYTGEYNAESRTRGMHGYLPNRENYFASFIASGAGIKKGGKVGAVSMPDAGVTIANAIKLKLRDATGKAIKIR